MHSKWESELGQAVEQWLTAAGEVPKTNRSYTVEQMLISLRWLLEEYDGNISLASRKLALVLTVRGYIIRGIKRAALLVPQTRSERVCGSGQVVESPKVEEKLSRWFLTQQEKRLNVKYHCIQKKSRKICEELGIDKANFVCSNKWIWGFCKWHSITSQRKAYHSQEDKHDAICWLYSTFQFIWILQIQCIFNIDETPA